MSFDNNSEQNFNDLAEQEDFDRVNRIISSIKSFTSFSKKVFEEINLARTNPRFYAEKVQFLWETYASPEENLLLIDGQEIFFQEGKQAFEEAILFLSSISPLNPFILKDGLVNAADDLLNQLILHEGNDNFDIHQTILQHIEPRMNRYGLALGKLFETVDYGNYKPEMVVINFILCDGDLSRKERGIIFSDEIQYVGVCSGIMPSEKVSTVICFCSHYFSKGDRIPAEIYLEYKKSFTPKVVNNVTMINGIVSPEDTYNNNKFNINQQQEQFNNHSQQTKKFNNNNLQNNNIINPYVKPTAYVNLNSGPISIPKPININKDYHESLVTPNFKLARQTDEVEVNNNYIPTGDFYFKDLTYDPNLPKQMTYDRNARSNNVNSISPPNQSFKDPLGVYGSNVRLHIQTQQNNNNYNSNYNYNNNSNYNNNGNVYTSNQEYSSQKDKQYTYNPSNVNQSSQVNQDNMLKHIVKEETKTQINNPRLSKYADFGKLAGVQNSDGSKTLETLPTKTVLTNPHVSIKQKITFSGKEGYDTKFQIHDYENKYWDNFKLKNINNSNIEKDQNLGRKSPNKSRSPQIKDPFYYNYYKIDEVPQQNPNENTYNQYNQQTNKTNKTNITTPYESYTYYSSNTIKLPGQVQEKDTKTLNDYYNKGLFNQQISTSKVNKNVDILKEKDEVRNKLKNSTYYVENNSRSGSALKESFKENTVKIAVNIEEKESSSRVHKHNTYDESTIKTVYGAQGSNVKVTKEAKEKNLQLKNIDYLNFIKSNNLLTPLQTNQKSMVNNLIKTHLSMKIESIGKENSYLKNSNLNSYEDPFELNIISLDNKEGYLLDLMIIKEFDFSPYSKFKNLIPKINYFLLEPITDIANYLKNTISEMYSKKQINNLFNVQVLDLDMGNFDLDNPIAEEELIRKFDDYFVNKRFDVIVINRCVERFSLFSVCSEEFLSKMLYVLSRTGEMLFFADQIEGKLAVREYYNTAVSQSSGNKSYLTERNDYYTGLVNNKNILTNSSEITANKIWETINQNEKFLIKNNYLTGVKQVTDLLDISSCFGNEVTGVHLICKIVNKRIIKMEELSRINQILRSYAKYDKNENKYYLLEKISVFIFKRKEENKTEEDIEFDFNLPVGLERLHIIERTVSNPLEKSINEDNEENYDYRGDTKRVLVRKEYYFTKGLKEVVESIY